MSWHLGMSAYLCAFIFWLELSLSLMGILMIGRLTGGRWFNCAESVLQSALPGIEVLAVLFIPILFVLPHIYPWAGGMSVGHETPMREEFFLNPFWFRVRAFVYWTLWIGFARLLRSAEGRRPLWNGLGLLMMLFTCSFSAMDWIMTLDPKWSSTGFGVAFIASALISGFSFVVLSLVSRIGREAPMRDYGNLLLMSILFWIYVNFLEYLIIWSGQIPREMHWYRVRSLGSYGVILALGTSIGFLVPFFALLFRKVKQTPGLLIAIGGILWITRWFEAVWLVFPEQNADPFLATLTTFLISIVLGFVWLSLFHRRLRFYNSALSGGLRV